MLVILAVLAQAQVQAHVGTDTADPRLLVTLVVLAQAQVQAHVGKDRDNCSPPAGHPSCSSPSSGTGSCTLYSRVECGHFF